MAAESADSEAVRDTLQVVGLHRACHAVQMAARLPDRRATRTRVVVEQQARAVAREGRRLPVDLVDGDRDRQRLTPVADQLELLCRLRRQAWQAQQEVP